MAIGGHSSIYQIGETGPMMTQNANFTPIGEWGIGSTAGTLPPGTLPVLANLQKLWDPNMQVPGGTTAWDVPMMIVDNFAFAIEVSTTGVGDITWAVSASANTPDGKTNTWAWGPVASPPFPFGSSGSMGGSLAPNNIIQNGATPGNYVDKLLLPDNGTNYIGVAGWNPGNPPAQGPVGGNGGNPYLFKRGTWNLSFTNNFAPAAINQHFTQLPATFNFFATPRRQNISTASGPFGAYPQFLIDTRNLSAASNSWSVSNIPLRSTGLWDMSFVWGIVGITSGGDYSQGVSGDLLHLTVTGTSIETIGSGY